jgi:dihydroflavonol-4-reductase
LACPSAWREIESSDIGEIVLRGLDNLLNGADEGARIVFVSSLAAIGPAPRTERLNEEPLRPARKLPGMAYAYAKMRAEEACREASARGRDIVVVNPAETYGPNDERLVTAGNLIGLLRPPLTLVCRGGTCIAHVDDVAEGIVAALEKGRSGERYILGGDNLDHVDLARLVLAIAGRRQPVVAVPNVVFRWATRVAAALGIALPYDRYIVPYATRYWFADNSKARRELEVRFRPARETLQPTLDWLKQAGYVQ